MEGKMFSHGGVRKGAGRPKKDTRPIALRLSSRAISILEGMAHEGGCSKSIVVEKMLLDKEE